MADDDGPKLRYVQLEEDGTSDSRDSTPPPTPRPRPKVAPNKSRSSWAIVTLLTMAASLVTVVFSLITKDGESYWAARYLLGGESTEEAPPIPFGDAYLADHTSAGVLRRPGSAYAPGAVVTLWFENLGPLQAGPDGEVALRCKCELRRHRELVAFDTSSPVLEPSEIPGMVHTGISATLPLEVSPGEHTIEVLLTDEHSGRAVSFQRVFHVHLDGAEEVAQPDRPPRPPAPAGCSLRQLPQDQP